MERVLHRQHAKSRLISIAVLVAGERAGKLKRALPRLRSAVGEERAVEAGKLRQALGKLRLIRRKKKIGGVNELSRLPFDRLGDRRMRIAQRVNADPA